MPVKIVKLNYVLHSLWLQSQELERKRIQTDLATCIL